jgi:hypothetical protein
LQLAFDPAPTTIRIDRCGYVSKCKARGCLERATLVAEKVDVAGRHIRQIELCLPHCDVVIARERKRGLEISDRAIGTKALPPPRWWRNAPHLDARISSTTEPAGADSTTSTGCGDRVTFVEERAEFAVVDWGIREHFDRGTRYEPKGWSEIGIIAGDRLSMVE